MPEELTIAIDAMGGDRGSPPLLAGADLAAARLPGCRFLLFGDEAVVTPLWNGHARLRGCSSVIHCAHSVPMNARPGQALRDGRRHTSMWCAIEAVKNGEADIAVSAGNTGALMAMAKICLRPMASVERPAIAAVWPTMRGHSIVLDVGANIGTLARQLVDHAILGGALGRILFDLERPRVGLLNIGVEEIKGLEVIREAGAHLREADLPMIEYVGFVEGHDIGKGTADIVVTEGFAGNIALKSAEGTARQITAFLRRELEHGWRNRLGALLARPAFLRLREKLDPARSNGGVFLGLNGLVIKSHGNTDPDGFANAIAFARRLGGKGLVERIARDFASAEYARLYGQ